MKRILSFILAVLLGITIVSCGRDGNTPAPVSTQGTSGTSVTSGSSGRPLQTSAQTQKPKPPVHPAVSEVHRAIDRALSTDESYFSQSMRLSLYGCESSESYSERLHIVGENTDSPSVAISDIHRSDSFHSPSNIYFKDGYYYVSEFDVKAKIPEGSGFEIDRYMGLRRLVMRKIDGVIPTDEVGSVYDKYMYFLDSKTTNAVFADLIDSFDGTVSAGGIKVSGIIKGDEASVTVIVSRSGKLSSYEVHMEFGIYDPEDTGKLLERGWVNVKLSYDVSPPAGGVQVPDGGGYVELERYGDISELIFNSAVSGTVSSYVYSVLAEAKLKAQDIMGEQRTFDISSRRIFGNLKDGVTWRETTSLKGNGKDISSDVFCADCICYENRNGIKTKYIDVSYSGLYRPTVHIDNIDGRYILSSEFLSTKNGILIKFSMDGKGFVSLFRERAMSVASIMADGNEVADVSVKNVRMTAQISDESLIQGLTLEYDVEVIFLINGAKFAMRGSVSETVTVDILGTDTEIEPPDDLGSYAEV